MQQISLCQIPPAEQMQLTAVQQTFPYRFTNQWQIWFTFRTDLLYDNKSQYFKWYVTKYYVTVNFQVPNETNLANAENLEYWTGSRINVMVLTLQWIQK